MMMDMQGCGWMGIAAFGVIVLAAVTLLMGAIALIKYLFRRGA